MTGVPNPDQTLDLTSNPQPPEPDPELQSPEHSGPEHSGPASAQANVVELAQTLAHDTPPTSDLRAGDLRAGDLEAGELQVNKQCQDLAFAVDVLQSGFTNTRSLASATKSWTTYGVSSLGDHLVSVNVLSRQQQAAVLRRSRQRLASLTKLEDSLAGGNGSVAGLRQSVRQREWVKQIDPTGKIAKLLGIADTSILADDQIENRQVASSYTLLRRIGQGGLGVVWLARDQNLQRYVAIKEISRDVADDDPALDHFRREAEITGRLEHPCIVPVYQYGEDEATGKSFYAMRFLGKKTMQDAIVEYHERREAGNHDPMMMHQLLSALISVCHAIGHAHSRRVIHRDIKPENIAIDEFGQVTVLDWGLAKINDATGMYDVNGRIEPGDLHSASTTHSSKVLGTPLYMAPEQAAGRLEQVDELTDVYGLGGVLYAILTGLAPHQSAIEDADTVTSRSEVLSKIVSGAVVAPRSIVHQVSPELNAVCLKALACKRYLRYESATSFADDLQRYMVGAPVTAYKPPVKQYVKRWMAGHPTLTQSILLLISLLMIGGAAIAFTARQGRRAVQQSQYSAVRDFAHELEVNLNFETDSLVRNLHFVSELPLMESIIQTQQHAISTSPTSSSTDVSADNGNERPSNERPGNAIREVSPDEWLDRQGSVFDGLLRANPDYLAAATCAYDSGHQVRELVRSDRISSGGRVHRVPIKQLMVQTPSSSETPEARILQTLRPEQVLLITNDQFSDDIFVRNRSPLVLCGVRAIFDDEGELFGLNFIELDLRSRLERLCLAVAPEYISVCITDAEGEIVAKYRDGHFNRSNEGSVTKRFPQLQSFFAPDSHDVEFGDDSTFFAKRVRLGDDTSTAMIGIVAHIPDDLNGN